MTLIDRYKRPLARGLQRAPWIVRLMQIGWRRFGQPWITVGALGAVFNDRGEMLLVEHVFHPISPWGLPGGWMNRNEDPSETVARELLEETGLQVRVDRPLIIRRTPELRSHLDIAFLCEAAPGTIRLSGELLDYRWVDPANPPPLMSFHRQVVAAALIARAGLNQAIPEPDGAAKNERVTE